MSRCYIVARAHVMWPIRDAVLPYSDGSDSEPRTGVESNLRRSIEMRCRYMLSLSRTTIAIDGSRAALGMLAGRTFRWAGRNACRYHVQ